MEPSPTQNDTTNYNDPAATQQQLSTMSIGIIILCVLFGLSLVIVLLLLFMRRRRLHQQQQQNHDEKTVAQQQPQPTPGNNSNNHCSTQPPHELSSQLNKQKHGKGRGFKQRIKERLPWYYYLNHSVSNKPNDEEERIDDLVFSAIQQHHPTPPSHPSHPYHRQHHYHHYPYHHHHYSNQLLPQNHHHHQQQQQENSKQQGQGRNESTMFEEGYSYTQSSTLRGTMTRASHCSSSIAPHDTDPVLASLARQHEFDRVGYYKNPNAVSSDRDEEEAMLQRLSMSSYHVW
ncbi:hypothetical protein BDA99DRAFT_141805 [Phascolomyces articulosus]|uniref:Uncharacterized protein n=1 Tax=Phascolomyces articulosus TaxID=60185 RepID=A0AAD5K5R8_9FUNG|nr:hypothetical protein BDA99DRAFT_141805 [Phascolomyces articulosus]